MLMLDTHILVWLDQGSDFLGARARRTIEAAHMREELGLATVSFWEIGMLIVQERLKFDGVLSDWRVGLLNSGFNEIPQDGAIALSAAGIKIIYPTKRIIGAMVKLWTLFTSPFAITI